MHFTRCDILSCHFKLEIRDGSIFVVLNEFLTGEIIIKNFRILAQLCIKVENILDNVVS